MTGATTTSPALVMAQMTSASDPHHVKKVGVDIDIAINGSDDDDDHNINNLMAFDNSKRKSSWSAANLRQQLGSPRMAPPHGSHNADTEEKTAAYYAEHDLQDQEQSSSHGSSASDQQNQPPSQPTVRAHKKKERSCSSNSGVTLLQELGSALVSCGGVRGQNCGRHHSGGSSSNSKHSNDNTSTSTTQAEMAHMASASWIQLKDSIHKAVKGDLDAARDAWRRNDFDDGFFTGMHPSMSGDDDDSILTYDNYTYNTSLSRKQKEQLRRQDEETMQIRRLTSWGTVGTFETVETSGTADTDGLSYLNNAAAKKGAAVVVEDDDGIPIQNAKLLLKKKNAQSKKNKGGGGRKRVVRFDYPPISSLRECPRTQPDQIKNLFFTEGELEQIEDDRYSTISADDVEIVAISTSTADDDLDTSAAGNDNNHGDSTNIDQKSPTSQHADAAALANSVDPSFLNYVATPFNNKRKGRRASHPNAFSFDERNEEVPTTANAAGSANRKGGRSSRRSSRTGATANVDNSTKSSPADPSSRRMIKSVQIYLRERSVG